jgi:hypothetical protein
MRSLIVCLLTISALAVPSAGRSAPIQWSENDHWYEAVHVPAGITWDDASIAAEAVGGYLATSTSDAENGFIFSLVAAPQFWYLGIAPFEYSFGPWLGGYQFDSGAEPAGHWRWVTEEPWIFTNWAATEPNNSGGNEDRLHFFTNTNVGALTPGSTWNDAPIANSLRGYVIEWSGLPTGVDGSGSPVSWEQCSWGRIKSLHR